MSTTKLPVVQGGTGQSSFADGELLIGNSTGNTLSKATLTAGANVTITNGNGSIEIAAAGGGGGGGFPVANAVFVDPDGSGDFTYATLELALVSWRMGGDAQVAYGTPNSVTNPGEIRIAAGVLSSALSFDIDVDVAIVGEGKEQTIVQLTASQSNFFTLSSATASFREMTVDSQANTYSTFQCPVVNVNVFRNVHIKNSKDSGSLAFAASDDTGSVGVQCYDCTIEITGTGSDVNYVQTSNVGGGAAKFYNCLFTGGGTGTGAFFQVSRSTSWEFYNCQFIANTAYLFNQFFSGTWGGKMVDCQATNIGGKIAYSSASGFSPFISGCQFQATDHVLDSFGGIIENSYLLTTGTDKDAIHAALDGAIARSNTLIGNGAGVAFNGAGTAQVVNNNVRNPTGDVAGSWLTGAAILPLIATAGNVEIPAATIA